MFQMKKFNYISCVFDWTFKGSWKKLTSRDRLDRVRFYDYSDLIGEIISQLSQSELDILRLHIYQDYKHYINFCSQSWIENWIDWEIIVDWYKISSQIFNVPLHNFATYLPKKIRKLYFDYDKFYEKFLLKTDLFDYLR